MADADITTSRILANIEELDVSNAYCLYQRRYPRRLPKLDDSPKKCSTLQSLKDRKKLKSTTPLAFLDEAMPLKEEDHFFGKREKRKGNVHEEVKNISLEDFQEEEEDSSRDVLFQKPVSTKNAVSFHINVDNAKKHGQASKIACTSSINRSNNNFRRSSSDYSIPINTVRNPNPRPRVDFSQRSQSVFEPRSRGRRSPSVSLQRTTRRPCSKSSPQIYDFIPQFRSQKVTSIQGILKNKAVVSNIKRRHTIQNNLKSEDLINDMKDIREVSTDNGVKINLEPLPDVCKSPVIMKVIDKTSREYFFNNCLENDKQMEWLDDTDYKVPPQRSASATCSSKEVLPLKGEAISYRVAYTLRMLLFGSCLASFTSSWREQVLLYYRPNDYFLKFHKDGPVEIMVSLQAYILKHLLFEDTEEQVFDSKVMLSPNSSLQHQLLLTSVCNMIWKVGEEKYGVIALPIGECRFIPDYSYRNDDITEKMELFKFMKREELDLFMKENIHKFQDSGNHGCISLLYSLMLTRGLSRFFGDCSEIKHGVLETGATSERSQPLINLCIHGKAVPNNFNKDTEVYDEVLNKIEIHKGIEKRCDFGYLSHTEFVDKKLCEVGSCLKTPRYPIWVLNNNGTLSILFCVKRGLLSDWKLERRFDLYYFQGIPRYVITNDIDIRLTIDTIQTFVQDNDEEDISTLEETIRTKWADSVIEWNGYARF